MLCSRRCLPQFRRPFRRTARAEKRFAAIDACRFPSSVRYCVENYVDWLRSAEGRSFRGESIRRLRNSAASLHVRSLFGSILGGYRLAYCGRAFGCQPERSRAARPSPKLKRDRYGIEVDPRPPVGLISMPVELSMMEATHRNGELVADLATKGPRL